MASTSAHSSKTSTCSHVHEIATLAGECATLLSKARETISATNDYGNPTLIDLICSETNFRLWCREYDARPRAWQALHPGRNPGELSLETRLRDGKGGENEKGRVITEVKERLSGLISLLEKAIGAEVNSLDKTTPAPRMAGKDSAVKVEQWIGEVWAFLEDLRSWSLENLNPVLGA